MADLQRNAQNDGWVLDTTGGQGSGIPASSVAQAQQRAKDIPVNAADAEKPGENHPRVMVSPEGWVLDDREPTLQHQTRKISKTESAARSAAQTLSLGFADEIEAGVRSILGPEKYDELVKKIRRDYRDAALQHEYVTAGTGALAQIPLGIGLGKVLPGGAMSTGWRSAATGAGVSALDSYGHSDKPFLDAMRDAAAPAVIGGVSSGLTTRMVNNAPERVDARMMGDLTDGATASMRDKTAGVRGRNVSSVVEVMKKYPAIRKNAAGKPGVAAEAAGEAKSAVGEQIGQIYDAVDAAGPSLRVSDVLGAIEKVKKGIANDPGKSQIVASLDAQAERVLEYWGDKQYIPTRAVATLRTDLGELAFAGNVAIPPKMAKRYAQQLYGELNGLIDRHVNEVARLFPDQKIDLKTLKGLNSEYSTLKNMEDTLSYRASRYSTPSTRLKDQIRGEADVGVAAASLPMWATKKVLEHTAIPAIQASDYQLARLVNAARKGSTPAQLTQLAVELGLSRAAGEAVGEWANRGYLSKWATGSVADKATATDESEQSASQR